VPTVAVVDYGASNIKSIVRGLERAGATVSIARAPDEMAGVDGLVLPGVGAAGAAMRGLRERDLVRPLTAAIEDGAPFLGVCLGMQLLLGAQEEDDEMGLGIIGGHVRRLRGVKVPHMGWNTADPVARDTSPDGRQGPLAGLGPRPYLYFVHSYYVELDPAERDAAVATTGYGDPFVSVIARDNVWGAQFHPEKSGEAGTRVLRNFVAHCEFTAGAATGGGSGAGAPAPVGWEAAS